MVKELDAKQLRYTCDSSSFGFQTTAELEPLDRIIGQERAIEALKLICEIGTSLSGRLVLLDGLSMEWNEIRLRRNPQCPVCGSRNDSSPSAH